jgi:hypothetical protein
MPVTSAMTTRAFAWRERIERIGQAMSAGESARGRDLIEQRLEAVMVEPVDDGHVDRRARERLGGFEPAESRAYDDDVGTGRGRGRVHDDFRIRRVD